MAILYTQTQVQNAQNRAQVAMYLISKNIENGFYYFYNPVYQTYKALQYDIYTLFNVIGNESQYVTYNPNPTVYESQFYDLVGSMINKTKQFDVYGEFDGSINPNYQLPAGTIIEIINPASYLAPMDINWADFSTDGEVDGGRNTYYNTVLAGINPFMQLTTTELVLGVDYNLIPSGGFVLLDNGNLPFIYEGQFLRAYSYDFMGSIPNPDGNLRLPIIVEDPSGTPLTRTYLNTTYPYPAFITGDIITSPDANLQYLKLDNNVDAEWNEESLNYAG